MKYVYLYIVLASFFIVQQANGQANYSVDELKEQLRTATVDSEQVRYLYRLGDTYVNIDLEKATWYADTGMRKAEQIGWQKGIAALSLLKGNIYNRKGEADAALAQYNKALAIHRKRKDKAGVASALNDIAVVYHDQTDYVQALTYYNQSLDIAKEIADDKLIGRAHRNIGNIFYAQGDYDKALGYYQVAMQHFIKWGNNKSIADINDAIANVYLEKKDYTTAEVYYKKALAIHEETNNPSGIASVYSHMGHLEKSDLNKAMAYKLKAQAIWDTLNPRDPGSVFNLGNIGYGYFEFIKRDTAGQLSNAQRQDYLQKATSYTKKSIAYCIDNGDKDGESHYLLNLAEITERQGNYKEALAYTTKSYAIKDSLFSQENKNKIAALESAREIETRDKQIKINELALSNEKRTRWALIAGAGLLLVIGALLFYQNRTRRKTNTTLLTLNNELDEANKIKARFFAILSHDLRSPVASLVNYLQLQEETAMNAADASELRTEIKKSASGLLENMETLLTWSKSQMENFKPAFRQVAVDSLFDYLNTFFEREKNIRFSFENDNVPFINSDPNYLQTIMYNLTANAVKALQQTNDAAIKWKVWKENDKVYLSITDNGPGINSEATGILFRNETSTNKKTGFGLHIIRDLAKAIQCTVSIDTAKSNGTRFILQL